MNEALVMHRMMEYSLEEIEQTITYDDLKSKIGGWVEIALRCDAKNIGQMIPGCEGEPGIIVMCVIQMVIPKDCSLHISDLMIWHH